MKVTKAERDEAIAKLREWLKPGDTVYTLVEHVSRSGMQREIRLLIPYVDTEHGRQVVRFLHPNYSASRVLGYRQGKHDGLIVNGCGMDMCWHVVMNLSARLYPDGFGCIGEGCPSNDHTNGDRDYRPHTCTMGAFPIQHNGMDSGRVDGHGAEGVCHWHNSGDYALVKKDV